MINDDYYQHFVELSLRQCKRQDYIKKNKVATHNHVARDLNKLKVKMQDENCTDVLIRLLAHEDVRVRLNAAAICLELHIFIDETRHVLESIEKKHDDPLDSFTASMLLKSL